MKISSFWKRARSWFSSQAMPVAEECARPIRLPSDDAIAANVERMLAMDFSDPQVREAKRDEVYQSILDLDSRIETIRKQAKGYPRGPISGEVWFAGYRMIGLTEALTRHFNSTGWLGYERNASGLWAKATLAVCSHYHHMVGPAMLACADCHERLGEAAEAIGRYAAVVDDFTFLLDEWEQEDVGPAGDDRDAIECLRLAAERLLALDPHRSDESELRSMILRIDAMLLRPLVASSE
jgi:hypothetical protein